MSKERIAGISLAIFFEEIQAEVAADIGDHFPYLCTDKILLINLLPNTAGEQGRRLWQ